MGLENTLRTPSGVFHNQATVLVTVFLRLKKGAVMSQESRILQHLKTSPITPLEALSNYGCLRLAARISDLRGRGHKITTEMVGRDGKRFAKYRLVA